MIRAFVMLLILIALTTLMIAVAWAGEVKFAWNANPTEEKVLGYRLYQLGEPNILLAETSTINATVQIEEGSLVAVLAFNAEAVSVLSSSVSVPITSPELPRDNWIVSASSEELIKENNAAVNAIDNDVETLWHTTWSIDLAPHYFLIQLPQPALLSGLSYLPRQDGGTNGIVTNYEIETSQDGIVWQNKINGSWANNSTKKFVSLPLYSANFVRLWGNDLRMAASEIWLHGNYEPELVVGFKLTYQQSDNQINWTNLSFVPPIIVPKNEMKKFFRLKIESSTP